MASTSSASAPAALETLPNELISLIAEKLIEWPPVPRTKLLLYHSDFNSHLGRSCLKHLSRADKRLRGVCAPILFAAFSAPHQYLGGPMSKDAPDVPGPHLLAHCRSLSVIFTLHGDFSAEYDCAEHLNRTLLPFVPKLEALRVATNTNDFLDTLLTGYKAPRRPLKLEVTSMLNPLTVAVFSPPLHLPLEVISLHGRELGPKGWHELLQLARGTERLELVRAIVSSRIECNADVESLKLGPSDSLRRLRIAMMHSDNAFPFTRQFLSLFGQPLTHLTLDDLLTAYDFDIVPGDMTLLPSLRVFEIRFASRSIASSLLDTFSASGTIDTLLVDAIGPVPFPSPNRAVKGICPDPAQLASCLRGGGFPGLKQLRVRYDAQPGEMLETMPLTHEGLRSLKAVCGTRGVAYHLRMFREGLVEMTEYDF